MSEPTPEQIFETCQAAAQEAAEALGRAFDCSVSFSVEQPSKLDLASLDEAYAGPGLLVVMAGAGTGSCVAISASTGILPEWYTAGDPTSRSKLDTLAQELGLILLPEDLAPEEFTAKPVDNLREALTRGRPAAEAVAIRLLIDRGEAPQAEALLIWPLEAPKAIWEGDSAGEAHSGQQSAGAQQKGQSAEQSAPGGTTQPATPPSQSQAGPAASSPAAWSPATVSERALPAYTRSLLRIELPAVVVLARKKQPLNEILKLVPGAIIQFEKSCDQPLELEVGGRLVAKGEAVKVGEKFGLRIISMVMPEERFRPVRPQRRTTVAAGR